MNRIPEIGPLSLAQVEVRSLGCFVKKSSLFYDLIQEYPVPLSKMEQIDMEMVINDRLEAKESAFLTVKEAFILHVLEEKGIQHVPRLVESRSGYIQTGDNQQELFTNLAVEYIPGYSFNNFAFKNQLSAIAACLQGAIVLRDIESAGFLHQDVKPGNLMITPENEVYVIDFNGASPVMRDNKSAVRRSTVRYSSYEKAHALEIRDGHIICDCRSDIYSLTLSLAEILGIQVDIFETHAFEAARQMFLTDLYDRYKDGSINESLFSFIASNTDKNPEARSQSYDEYITLLSVVLTESSLSSL